MRFLIILRLSTIVVAQHQRQFRAQRLSSRVQIPLPVPLEIVACESVAINRLEETQIERFIAGTMTLNMALLQHLTRTILPVENSSKNSSSSGPVHA
jgi:hypothetical protein